MNSNRSEIGPTRRRLNYWFWIPVLSLFVSMFVYGTYRRMKLRDLQEVNQGLASQLQYFSELAKEKESLIEKCAAQKFERLEKWRRAKSILRICRKLPEFPIDSGDLFVYQSDRTVDSAEIRFYAPEGDHEIELACGIRHWSKNARGGASISAVGTQSRKTFRLPSHSTGSLRLSIKNEGDECVLTVILFGQGNQELDRATFRYEKRVAFGRISGSTSGDLLFLPGELAALPSNYQSHNFDMQKTSSGMNSLGVTFDILPNTERNFICAEQVGEYFQPQRSRMQLGRLFKQVDVLDALGAAELRGDRLYFTPEKIEKIFAAGRRRSW